MVYFPFSTYSTLPDIDQNYQLNLDRKLGYRTTLNIAFSHIVFYVTCGKFSDENSYE